MLFGPNFPMPFTLLIVIVATVITYIAKDETPCTVFQRDMTEKRLFRSRNYGTWVKTAIFSQCRDADIHSCVLSAVADIYM